MVDVKFEYEGDNGLLKITTHFGVTAEVSCVKRTDEQFRLGGTAINDVAVYEGLILKLEDCPTRFRAFRTSEVYFEGTGILSPEIWDESDKHCYVTEHYTLDMEGKPRCWFISKRPMRDANYLFVNLDVIDGGGNVMKRYRVSPFTGEYICL